MFFVDCNDKSSRSHRYWISKDELLSGEQVAAAKPISERKALEICNVAIKERTSHPSTDDPDLITGSSSYIVVATGRNVVNINFSVKNAFCLKLKHQGACTFENSRLLDVSNVEK